MSMKEDDLLRSINKRLALLIKVTILDDLEGKKRTDQVKALEAMDFRDEDIIEVLGITKDNLRTIRTRMGK